MAVSYRVMRDVIEAEFARIDAAHRAARRLTDLFQADGYDVKPPDDAVQAQRVAVYEAIVCIIDWLIADAELRTRLIELSRSGPPPIPARTGEKARD